MTGEQAAGMEGGQAWDIRVEDGIDTHRQNEEKKWDRDIRSSCRARDRKGKREEIGSRKQLLNVPSA